MSRKDYCAQPWLVCNLAPDFKLDGVWQFPIVADESKGETFAAFCDLEDNRDGDGLPGAAGRLMQLREKLGHRFNLDDRTKELPIPGCTETSLRDRLRPEERDPERFVGRRFPFRIVYERSNERLLEISNATVHGLLHVAWMHRKGSLYGPVMAVYVKPRGLFGHLYMAAIYPFRVLVVYPAMMRSTKKRWDKWRLSAEHRWESLNFRRD